jgi:hypothetical protein
MANSQAMLQEVQPQFSAKDASTYTATKDSLSEAMFQDPKDFLSVLQQIAPRVSPNGMMTKNDLIVYAEHSSDSPKDRAAAQILASHFDTMSSLAASDRIDAQSAQTTWKLNRISIRTRLPAI